MALIVTFGHEDLYSDRIQACGRPSVLGPASQKHFVSINLRQVKCLLVTEQIDDGIMYLISP